VGTAQEVNQHGRTTEIIDVVTTDLDPRAKAIADQLRAEIAASEYRKLAPFVRALNEANRGEPTTYETFYRRVHGQAELNMKALLPALDLLGIDYLSFVARAMQRIG
jgi:hypothetical protein